MKTKKVGNTFKKCADYISNDEFILREVTRRILGVLKIF